MKPKTFACLLLALPITLLAQEPVPVPVLDGYVTRVASPTDFDANGFHVLWNEKTELSKRARSSDGFERERLNEPKPYFGAHVQIFGKLDKRKDAVKATKINFVTIDDLEIKGSALIDGLPKVPGGQANEKLVRADGYLILLNSKTAMQAKVSKIGESLVPKLQVMAAQLGTSLHSP